jgi:hypothetical protein
VEECGPCPVFASFTLEFALQLRKKDGKTSVRVRKASVRLRKTSVKVQCTYSIEFIIPKFIEGSTYFIHFPLSLGNGRSPHGYINQRLQVQFRAPDDDRCAARDISSLQ